jgi:hypothetical protein
MPGRISRARRAVFLVALLVSAAAYAYSLAGIMGASNELNSLVNARSVERSAPAAYRPPTDPHANCPGREAADRVEL